MPLPHLVEIARQVEGNHGFLASALGGLVDNSHHGPHALLERAAWAISLQLVVFDEVDSPSDQCTNLLCRRDWGEAHTGFDDRADNRTARDTGQLAGSLYAES